MGHSSGTDRKSTRLNSSHSQISYAVFCLKKKNDLGELFERGVELGHHLGGRSLLRAVNGTRAIRYGQRVRDVAGDIDLGLLPVRMAAADVDPRQSFQCQAARGELVTVLVKQVIAERLRHAGATVVGRAAADAHDEMPGARVIRML